MATKQSKESIVRAHLAEKNLTEDQTEFLVLLYKKIRRCSDPTNHNIWCNVMGDKLGMEDRRIRNLVNYFKDYPYRLTNTNESENFSSFWATDYFVDWMKDIGVM